MKYLPTIKSKPDDNVGRGIELVIGIVVFLGIGWLLDRWLGTKPLFMIVLFLFAVAGYTVKMWIGYDARMRAHEADLKAKTQAARRTATANTIAAVDPTATRRPARPDRRTVKP